MHCPDLRVQPLTGVFIAFEEIESDTRGVEVEPRDLAERCRQMTFDVTGVQAQFPQIPCFQHRRSEEGRGPGDLI